MPEVKVRSSTFSQFPALASELTLTVQPPPVTLTEATSRIQAPFEVTGRSVRCSAEPQFRRAR